MCLLLFIIVYCYIELSFGCCDAQMSPFEGVIKEFLILILMKDEKWWYLCCHSIHAVNS